MVSNIKTITNRKSFETILNRFFLNSTAFVKSNNGNIQVRFLECSGGLAIVKIPMVLKSPDNSLIFTRHKDTVICAYLRFCEARSKDIFVFNPVMFQVMSAERKDVRKLLNIRDRNKELIFATNVISDYNIRNSISHEKQKVERIKEIIKYNNEQNYKHLKLYFCEQGMKDSRMKYFYSKRSPIFIPDFQKFTIRNQDELLYFYMNNIYKKDRFLNIRQEFRSEVSVPILYNTKIPYGYIQVNETSPFSRTALSVIQRIAVLANELGNELKIFTASGDRLLVSDVSTGGLGVVFKDSKLIPNYKQDSYVSLDMLLPQNKKASILADVRHLEMMENKVIKVGFEIKDMDNLSVSNYESFLRRIDQ